MPTYTIPLGEAETQLRKLVEQAQTTRDAIYLTGEKSAKTVAVLLESDSFEALRRHERQLFFMQLQQLLDLCNAVQTQGLESMIHIAFVDKFSDGMRILWEICPPPVRRFCAALRMAGNRLTVEGATFEQITVLRECLDLLRYDPPRQQAMERCRQRLIECGLPPMPVGDDSLAQMYIDEL